MAQTKVQKASVLRFGSGLVAVGDDIASLVDLGAMKAIKFAETWDEIEVESDNAGTVHFSIRNQKCNVTGSLMETDLITFNKIRGGIDNFTSIPATTVVGALQTIGSGYEYKKFILIENQNGDGSSITINSITQDPAGTPVPLVADTDYFKVQNSTGQWGIMIVDTATSDNAFSSDIDYDYTPSAANKMTSGGKFTISPKVVRITNTDEAGKKFRITVYKAYNAKGIELEFKSDESGEVMECAIDLKGQKDITRTAGDQLFELYDEQGVL